MPLRGRWLFALLLGCAWPLGEASAQSPAPAALSVETVGATEGIVGQALTVVVVVRNRGAMAAERVRLEERLPADAHLVRAEPPPDDFHDERLAWDLGTVEGGGERRLRLVVEPGREGDFQPAAALTHSQSSWKARVTRPRLSVTLTGPETVMVGDRATFELRIANSGSGVATGLLIHEELPPGLRHAQGRTIEADLPRLLPGETKTIALDATAVQPGPQVNEVRVTADGGLVTSARVELLVVPPGLRLRLTGPDQRYLGRAAEFDLEIVNGTDAPTNHLVVECQIPEGMRFLLASDAGHHDAGRPLVSWNLELGPRERRGLAVRVAGDSVGTMHCRAFARADGLAETAASASLEVGAAPMILLEVRDAEDPLRVGQETVYEIRVVNQGMVAGTNLRLTAMATEGLMPVEGTGPSNGRVEGQVVRFELLPRLALRAEAVYRVKARATKAGEWRLNVQLFSDQLRQPVCASETTHFWED